MYKNASAKVNMAPNSNFYYSVPLKELKDGVEKNVAFTPGKYEFEVLASNEQGEWKLRKEFEITKVVFRNRRFVASPWYWRIFRMA